MVPARPIAARPALTAAGLYAILVLAFFYPVLGRLPGSLIGPPEDNMKYLWTLWWGARALTGRTGESGGLTFSRDIFFPEGSSLLYNDYSWYNLFLSLPLQAFLPLPAVYNLLLLHGFVVAGVGGFLLARYLTREPVWSLAGGFVFAFSPMHLAHAQHHMNISSIQFLPFFLLFFLRSLGGGRRRDLALAWLFFLLNALCSWNYLVFSLYLIAVCYGGLALLRRRLLLPDALAKCALLPAATFAVLSPWLVPMISLAWRHPVQARVGHDLFTADLAGFAVPHAAHWLSDLEFVSRLNASYTGHPWSHVAYLGLVNLALLGWLLRRREPGVARLAAGAAAFSLLAMGSHLHVLGRTLPIPLPYRLLESVPLLGDARAPARAMAIVYLFLAPVATLGLARLADVLRGQRLGRPVLAAVGAALLFDFYAPVRNATPVRLPPVYEQIERGGPRFGILDLPWSDVNNARYMMYQAYHGLPIVEGLVPRRVGRTLADAIPAGFDADLLERFRVRYVVVHRRLFDAETGGSDLQYRRWLRRKGLDLIYEDPENLLFRTYRLDRRAAPRRRPGRWRGTRRRGRAARRRCRSGLPGRR